VKANATAGLVRAEAAVQPDDFTVEQRFFASKDGTRVPMFIVRKKGLTGPAPTLLYAYGGFNISLTPTFSATRLAWLEQGGTYVLANIRGGGEYGKAWHDAGRLSNKQNVFDDFIGAGEALIAAASRPRAGWRSRAAPTAACWSGGGQPAAGPVRRCQSGGRRDGHAALRPLHGRPLLGRRLRLPQQGSRLPHPAGLFALSQRQAGRVLPGGAVTTADTDDRVVPGHSFKYVAALQNAHPTGNPQLIRIETRAGHGSGKPTDKIIEEASDVFAFMARFTGLEIK
jgi:prolyl oligopeptidase